MDFVLDGIGLITEADGDLRKFFFYEKRNPEIVWK